MIYIQFQWLNISWDYEISFIVLYHSATLMMGLQPTNISVSSTSIQAIKEKSEPKQLFFLFGFRLALRPVSPSVELTRPRLTPSTQQFVESVWTLCASDGKACTEFQHREAFCLLFYRASKHAFSLPCSLAIAIVFLALTCGNSPGKQFSIPACQTSHNKNCQIRDLATDEIWPATAPTSHLTWLQALSKPLSSTKAWLSF